ncbi:DUF1642 domain-containing protein [Streptococcus suis]|uniref:DUF1642 domain-containing protein n=1 Tax=Streptococcus suis TaxID=1307 RepID=UPI00041EC674|nr:DUF1642 domain-containing protein [Streptococcus suis]
MNKQEAIEKLTEIANGTGWISHKSACNVVVQIHEPQKVVVPKYISDKIEYCKNAEGYGLFHAMDYCFNYKDSADWLECNQETFARAWLFGYEVEKEQLYTIEIPDPNSNWKYSFLSKLQIGVVINASDDDSWKTIDKNQLTESEIKQDFEWAWDAGFAKEVE